MIPTATLNRSFPSLQPKFSANNKPLTGTPEVLQKTLENAIKQTGISNASVTSLTQPGFQPGFPEQNIFRIHTKSLSDAQKIARHLEASVKLTSTTPTSINPNALKLADELEGFLFAKGKQPYVRAISTHKLMTPGGDCIFISDLFEDHSGTQEIKNLLLTLPDVSDLNFSNDETQRVSYKGIPVMINEKQCTVASFRQDQTTVEVLVER